MGRATSLADFCYRAASGILRADRDGGRGVVTRRGRPIVWIGPVGEPLWRCHRHGRGGAGPEHVALHCGSIVQWGASRQAGRAPLSYTACPPATLPLRERQLISHSLLACTDGRVRQDRVMRISRLIRQCLSAAELCGAPGGRVD